MKQIIFALFLLSAISITSCRKDGSQPDIKQYDDTQIQNYIKANGITGMTKANDTSGIYYKIIMPGSGKALDFPDKVSFVFSLKSFDGKYTSADTIINHFEEYLGHISNDRLPLGLELGIKNLAKYRGASVRLLIPSHLAYGKTGYGTGSNQTTNTKIAGNQCLDYYVHVVGDQVAYDESVIQNYLKANNLTGYTRVKSILDTTATPTYYYYQILTPGTNANDPITDNSTITSNYTGQLLNENIFDGSSNGANVATFNITDIVPDALTEAFKNYATAGTTISIIMPSRLGYGENPAGGIPANSCLKFSWKIITVTP